MYQSLLVQTFGAYLGQNIHFVRAFPLGNQAQAVQGPGVLRSGGDQVNAGRLDAAVAQHIGQLRHIPARLVKAPGEQVAQVVGKHLGRGLPPPPGTGTSFPPRSVSGTGFFRFW